MFKINSREINRTAVFNVIHFWNTALCVVSRVALQQKQTHGCV